MSIVGIHEQCRSDPGPIGLAEAMEGIPTSPRRLSAVRVLTREMMDGEPHVAELAEKYLGSLFAAGAAEVERNIDAGIFRPGDPMHVLINVAGLTLYYFQMLPLLARIWERDPLAPATLTERAAAVRDSLLYGLLQPTAPGEIPS